MEPAFILDVHLGKLAKLLRMMGFDTFYRNDLQDAEIIAIAQQQNRIVLTRDRGILKNKKVKQGHFVESTYPKQQLEEILEAYSLHDNIQFLSRCILCNGIIAPVGKEEVDHALEPRTRRHFTRFFKCTRCGKIYWEGSHFDRMKDYYKAIINPKT